MFDVAEMFGDAFGDHCRRCAVGIHTRVSAPERSGQHHLVRKQHFKLVDAVADLAVGDDSNGCRVDIAMENRVIEGWMGVVEQHDSLLRKKGRPK
jgi:hypothetical protein